MSEPGIPGYRALFATLDQRLSAPDATKHLDAIKGEIAALYRTRSAKISGVKYARVGQGTQGALTFQKAMGPSGPALLVFDDLETACEWLGINADDVRPTLDELREELRAND